LATFREAFFALVLADARATLFAAAARLHRIHASFKALLFKKRRGRGAVERFVKE
jgi:hypothetical protein